MALADPPDAVIVDIGLPGLDGYEVGRRLREALGDRVRLVALTGYSQPEDRRRVREAGFDVHLVKPIVPADILAGVDHAPTEPFANGGALTGTRTGAPPSSRGHRETVLVTEEASCCAGSAGKATAPQRQIVARARRVHAGLRRSAAPRQRGTAALGHDRPCACGPTPGTRSSRSYGAVMTSSGKCSGWATAHTVLGSWSSGRSPVASNTSSSRRSRTRASSARPGRA